jgi:hypothetical protein
MSANRLKKLRRLSFEKQRHQCFYCKHLMWEDNPEAFSRFYGITLKQARLLRSTAEHLVAQQDNGGDTPDNVVAACLWCNQRRHKGRHRKAPDPETYKHFISMRMEKGLWHPVKATRLARRKSSQ